MGMSTSWFGSGFDGGDAGARGEGEVGGTVDRSGSSASRSSYQPSPSRSGAATPVSQVSSPHLRPQNHPSDFASLREDNLRQSPFYPPPPQQPSSSSSSIHHANEELFQLQHNPNLSSLVPNSDPSESHEQFRSYEEFVAASQAWLNPLLAGGNDASNIALSSTMDFSLGLEAPWANVSWSSDFRTQPSQQQQHHYHPQQQPHQSNEDFISAFQPNFDFDLPSPQRGQRGFSPMQFDLATETFGGDVGIGQDRGGRYDGTSNFAANSTDFLPSHPSPYSNPPSLDDAVLYPFEPPAAFEPFAPLTQQQQPSDVNSSDASSSRKIHKCGWSECGTDFEESMDLTVHINKDHVGSGKNWYTCGWEGCERGSKGFKKKQEVMKHIQTHTGHKPFVCDHPGCDKTFTQRASLTIHKQTHDGIKPFACPHCGQAFVKASNLAKHATNLSLASNAASASLEATRSLGTSPFTRGGKPLPPTEESHRRRRGRW
ncbi:hypothetical protein BDY24DRAFT_63520 [Mrakia frigida]|uniref:uncharacterized protein n=1 Tax=Mrakia frigida TaxID=29902 RepID=UPI003FCBFCEF